MTPDYWLRQAGKPLYPELEWNQPEHKARAGKLLIAGGTGYAFAAPANAYGDALAAGIGTAKVLLPNSMQKTVEHLFPEAEFAPSTPSGSFASSGLAPLLDLATWANGVLLPGDIGRSSETSVMLESFLEKYQGQVTITKDMADFFSDNPLPVLHRPETLLVLAMGQLRRLSSSAKFSRAFTSEMGLVALVDTLHEFTKRFAPYIITKHQGNYVVAVSGQVSTTPIKTDAPIWRIPTAATSSVWWLQNPTRPFQALTTAIYSLNLLNK